MLPESGQSTQQWGDITIVNITHTNHSANGFDLFFFGESQYMGKTQTYVIFPLNHPYQIYQIYNLFISFIHISYMR